MLHNELIVYPDKNILQLKRTNEVHEFDNDRKNKNFFEKSDENLKL
jgi:hypothetical protein